MTQKKANVKKVIGKKREQKEQFYFLKEWKECWKTKLIQYEQEKNLFSSLFV